MRKLLKPIAVLLSLLFMMSATAGCGDDADATVYFELNEKPVTADPQTAQSDAELILVRNLYEGLLRRNEDGKIVCAAAEDYQKNGLVYTFHLRQDAKWDDGTPLTADDFVFALRRAVSPETESPFVSRLFCIENAQKIRNGIADPTALGVTAKDARTLVVRLLSEDPEFEETLTTAVCMPCNREFFEECIGKYGLERQYVLCNGSYYMAKWNQEDFGIRILKNREYTGAFIAKNGGVFLSCSEKSSPLERLQEEDVDIAVLSCTDAQKAQKSGFSVQYIENRCWVLTISPEYTKNIRKSFAMLCGESVFSARLSAGIRAADSLYPAVLGETGAAGTAIAGYAPEEAKRLFFEEIRNSDTKKFPQTTLYYAEDDGMKPVVTDLVAHWQKTLSAFINIKPADCDALLEQLENRTLPMAIFPVTAKSGSVSEYLSSFYMSGDPVTAQQKLLSNYTVIPLTFESIGIAFCKNLSRLTPESGNGFLDFSVIRKK